MGYTSTSIQTSSINLFMYIDFFSFLSLFPYLSMHWYSASLIPLLQQPLSIVTYCESIIPIYVGVSSHYCNAGLIWLRYHIYTHNETYQGAPFMPTWVIYFKIVEFFKHLIWLICIRCALHNELYILGQTIVYVWKDMSIRTHLFCLTFKGKLTFTPFSNTKLLFTFFTIPRILFIWSSKGAVSFICLFLLYLFCS